jgi:hypothetical protein
MNAHCARWLILGASLAAPVCGLQAQSAPAPSTQSANAQTQSTPPAKPKPKKPAEPIDPDATAGVRGSGAMHTVRVFTKGKLTQGAHVVVKNMNGALAASCYTTESGECTVEIGADSYIIDATKNGRAGTVSLPVNDATGPIVIKLAKVKAESGAPKP